MKRRKRKSDITDMIISWGILIMGAIVLILTIYIVIGSGIDFGKYIIDHMGVKGILSFLVSKYKTPVIIDIVVYVFFSIFGIIYTQSDNRS